MKSGRRFPGLTVGDVLERLEQERVPISRTTLYRLEKKGYVVFRRGGPGQEKWRFVEEAELEAIIQIVKELYGRG